jgi:hypothetical protein
MPEIQGFNIQKFKSVIEQKGLHKNNKFLVYFPVPQFMMLGSQGRSQGFTDTNRTMHFWCDSATLPGVQLSLRQVIRYGYGPVEKKPFAPVFNDVTFTVMQDGSNKNWSYLHAWMSTVVLWDARQGINGSREQQIKPFEVFYKEDYKVDMTVIAFNDMGNPTTKIIFREAYPFTMGDLPLNWADNNTIMRIPVSFTFHDWFWASVPENEMLPIPTQQPEIPLK